MKSFLVSAYDWLHGHRPFYVAESIDKIGGGCRVPARGLVDVSQMAYEAAAASLGFLRPF
jgi:hypothetical protein